MAVQSRITASVLIALANLVAAPSFAASYTSDNLAPGQDIAGRMRAMSAGTTLDGHGIVLMAQAEPPPEELPKQKKKGPPEEGKPGEERPPEAAKPPKEEKRPEAPPARSEAAPPARVEAPAREEAPAQQTRPKPPAGMEAPSAEPPPPKKHEKPMEPAIEPQKAPPPKMAEPPVEPQEKPQPQEKPVRPKKNDAQPPMPPVGDRSIVTQPGTPQPGAPKGEGQPMKPEDQRPAGKKPGPNPAEQDPAGKATEGQKRANPQAEGQAPASQAPVGQPQGGQKPQAPRPAEPEPQAKPEPKTTPESEVKPAAPNAPVEPPAGNPPAGKPPAPPMAEPPLPGGQKPPAEAPGAPKASQPPVQPGAPATPRADAPMPPPPGPGNDDAGKPRPALLPPMNATQSREQGGLPGQGGTAGQGGKGGAPGLGGQPGQNGQPGQPGRAGAPGVPGAPGGAVSDQQLRPQLPPQEQAPFTPKELQRLRALADKPSQTDETIILPVDRGAPVLDSDKDNNWRRGMSEDQLRRLRQQADDQDRYAIPESDAQAQQDYYGNRPRPDIRIESIDQYQGRRLRDQPQFIYPDDVRVERSFDDDREVMDYGGQIVIRSDDNRRFAQYGRPPVYEQVDHQRVRITVFKENGDRIVSLRNRYGQLIQRSRIDANGQEYVLFYSPDLYSADDDRRVVYRDPGADLPPMRLRVPLNDYIIDVGSSPDRDYYKFMEQPPVEPVERVYTIDEVRNSARIRDKMRRIDLDTVTFATGSADISMNQAGTLKKVADAIVRVLKDDPGETFLIEGHTDAVGSAKSNLVLSDRRAESVANVLTQVYGIPPENMITQGYGEQFLKVMTYGPEQQNRRVTVRRVTPLVRPVQAAR
ncbi:OmpA family protein [Agrobacterium vitis]|uniref:OmpA family protein n=1 Tax=Agrobacterium vitis TaxID=373 RepID=UPI0030DF9AD3